MNDPARATVQRAPVPTRLFVQESGTGPPLLLIHGLMVSGALYEPVLPALGTHHRLIVPDLRGHGRSGALPGPYSVEQLARDLVQLLDELHVNAADVLGYSQGGAVAQQLARDYPRRVRGLVLGCTYAYNMLSPREQLEGMLSPWLVRILGTRRLGRLAIENGGGRHMAPETADWLGEIIAANDRARMVAAVEAMKAFDSRRWLNQISSPTLVIAGAEDEAVPPAHAQMLAQGIPGAQLRVIDGAGHFLLLTHTDIFVRAVEAFLVSVNRSRADSPLPPNAAGTGNPFTPP
jgi:3-oxoadipate enol-lactonase